MDRLASTEVFGGENKVCGNCGMHSDESNGCCRDEMKVIKLEQDQQTSQAIDFNLNSIAISQDISGSYILLPYENADHSRHHHNHSPPLLSKQDTYLQNSVFRI